MPTWHPAVTLRPTAKCCRSGRRARRRRSRGRASRGRCSCSSWRSRDDAQGDATDHASLLCSSRCSHGRTSFPARVSGRRTARMRPSCGQPLREVRPALPQCLSVRRPGSDPRVNGLVERSHRRRCSPIRSKRATTHRRTDQLSRSRHRWTAEGSPHAGRVRSEHERAGFEKGRSLTGADPCGCSLRS